MSSPCRRVTLFPLPTPCPDAEDDLALRAVVACARRRGKERRVERALLQATQDLTLCSAAACEQQRSDGTTAEKLWVELQHTRLLLDPEHLTLPILLPKAA